MPAEVVDITPFEKHIMPVGVECFFRESNHSYWASLVPKAGGKGLKGDERLLGWSTAGKALDLSADGLMSWSANLAREGKDWRKERDSRADQGTEVHRDIFAALATESKPPSLADVSDEARAYGSAAMKFWRDHSPEAVAVEQVVCDLELGVAGRFDLLCHIGGRLILADAKTAKTPKGEPFVNCGHHGQLAGYLHTAKVAGFPEAEEGWIVYLQANGEYRVEVCQASATDAAAAVHAYRASQQITKRVKAERKALAEATAA